jgi:hypothetical protein
MYDYKKLTPLYWTKKATYVSRGFKWNQFAVCLMRRSRGRWQCLHQLSLQRISSAAVSIGYLFLRPCVGLNRIYSFVWSNGRRSVILTHNRSKEALLNLKICNAQITLSTFSNVLSPIRTTNCRVAYNLARNRKKGQHHALIRSRETKCERMN